MLSIELQYFPCINYINTLCNSGAVDFCAHLPFKRSSFRNRMVIAGSTGPINLSIPIVGSRSTHLPFNQVEIDNQSAWQQTHFRTLVTAYGNSPFFQHYRDELELLFSVPPILLFEWNMRCLTWLLSKIRLSDHLNLAEKVPSNELDVKHCSDIYTPRTYNQHTPFLKYPQVFEDRVGFLPNLSMLDMLFNIGPEAGNKVLNHQFDLPNPLSHLEV